ncbi:MAG: hypothetical protein ACN6QY_24105 [Pseudomonas sp.]|uniref:hypothetical protein n=1 Tax=unclassified Pseudomonas TaxID=196821 RepID=UPI000730A867|nr:hypothetical protein [Pseudomonas sp. L5B5]KTC37107.1 hypothetical protein AO265_32730 [Pseudomonas sp. ABAC61]UCZ83509.1 hypothetical protein LGQ10_24600 [Pseudomonas sp. L5B5]
MKFLRSLFAPRQEFRSFALLDCQGRCQALRHSLAPPVGDGWVEIQEIRLNWLHQTLPASARISPRSLTSGVQPILAT